jgi:hypothetical protein
MERIDGMVVVVEGMEVVDGMAEEPIVGKPPKKFLCWMW